MWYSSNLQLWSPLHLVYAFHRDPERFLSCACQVPYVHQVSLRRLKLTGAGIETCFLRRGARRNVSCRAASGQPVERSKELVLVAAKLALHGSVTPFPMVLVLSLHPTPLRHRVYLSMKPFSTPLGSFSTVRGEAPVERRCGDCAAGHAVGGHNGARWRLFRGTLVLKGAENGWRSRTHPSVEAQPRRG
jgi:hypothetical protein